MSAPKKTKPEETDGQPSPKLTPQETIERMALSAEIIEVMQRVAAGKPATPGGKRPGLREVTAMIRMLLDAQIGKAPPRRDSGAIISIRVVSPFDDGEIEMPVRQREDEDGHADD